MSTTTLATILSGAVVGAWALMVAWCLWESLYEWREHQRERRVAKATRRRGEVYSPPGTK